MSQTEAAQKDKLTGRWSRKVGQEVTTVSNQRAKTLIPPILMKTREELQGG